MCNHEAKLYGRCLACGEQVDDPPAEDFTPAPAQADEHAPGADLPVLATTADEAAIARRFAEVDGILAGIGQRVSAAEAQASALQNQAAGSIGALTEAVAALRADVDALKAAASATPATPESPAVDDTPVP